MVTPTGYGATGLPPGVTVNTTTGEIRGWPAFVGEHAVSLQAFRKVPGQLELEAFGTKVLLVKNAPFGPDPKPVPPPPNVW